MKLFKRISLILLLPLVLIGGFNYRIDPDYSLRTNYIPSLVKALLEGKIVAGPVNVNSRLLKRKWIEQLTYSPDVLVLGSSRILALNQQSFQKQIFYNASVSNCTFQDMFAFMALFEKKPNRSQNQTILICTDQWLFGNSFQEKQWLVNRTEAIELAERAGVSAINKFPSKWSLDKEWLTELFSVKYLFRSVKSIGKVERFEICDTLCRDRMIFLPDGSRFLPQWVTHPSESDALQLARNYFQSSKDEQFTDLDPFQSDLFGKFIEYLAAKRNLNVVLYIPPYHPDTYQSMRQSAACAGILKADSAIQKVAEKYHLTILGSTNPEDLQLKSSDFYDAVHLKPEVLNRIISEYFFNNKAE